MSHNLKNLVTNNPTSRFMKTIKLSFCLLLATLVPRFAFADLTGPYTVDANTLYLFHFDEAAGGTLATNVGSKGGVSYSVNENPASATPPTVTTMLGAAGFVSGAANFQNCMTNPTSGFVFGYDFNNSGAYEGDVNNATPSADRLAMTNLNIGKGGQTPFTLEALIRPTTTGGSQEIICTDSDAAGGGNPQRGFQFRINAGTFQLQYIGGPSPRAISGTIPTTGPDAFVAGTWYHVAATYDGATLRLYWTKMDPSVGAAHLLNSGAISLGTVEGAVQGPLCIGSDNRDVAGEPFLGSIDEVRISSVARAANQMQFFSPLVSITQNPVSQNIDYNQSVTFSVGASSLTALGYQWRYNSNSIAGVTNSSYVITNVAAGNAGYYDVVVTNTAGFAATSSPALLVVGAANFLNHRYSFTNDTSDSIGGAWGTNFGTATVTGGALVLDGTSGTYMQLPPNLFTAANSTALTVEFWATFGVNANFVRVFDFGNTNVQNNGVNYVGFSPHNGSGGHQLHISPGDGSFQQQVTAAGTLDGLTRHIACVIDPPNQTLAIYTNGVLEAISTNVTVGIASLNDSLSFIGHSLFTADPYLNASIDELRIYKGALAGLSIKQSDDQGQNTILADGPGNFVTQPANTSVPVGQNATFTAAAVGYLPITYQWFKNGTLVPGATNASYSFATVIGDNNATVLAYATNTIGVTTYVTNSSTASLSVFLPPTLAWLDAANGGADSDWNTTSLNWTNDVSGGGVTAFSQTNGVIFDNRGSGSPNVNIPQSITPYKITANAATDYLLTSSANGVLVSQGSITKLNSGKLTIDLTNNLTGPTTISGGTLQVGAGDSLGSLGSGPVTNNATLSFNRSDAALNVPNAIHGSGTVSFDGGGTVTVSGASDYTGATLINAGVLNLQSSSGLGAASAGTIVANGGQLYITANVDVAEGLTLNGSGDNNGALRKGGAGLTTCLGPVTLASDSTIGLDTGATLTLSNTLTGAAALTVNGGGTLALNKANNYSGGTTLTTGIIGVNASGALGSGTVTAQSSGAAARFVLGDGVTLSNPFVAMDVSPGVGLGLLMVNDNTNGTVTTLSGPITLSLAAANGGDFVGPTSSGYLNVSGPVSSPDGTIMSIRLGNLRFSGGGSYTEIQVGANTTSIGANNGVATNVVMDIAGNGSATDPTYFDLNGFNQKLAGLKNTVAPANIAVVTNSSVTAGTLTLDLGTGNSFSFSGSIAGKLSLAVNSGTQILTGTNAYSGNTTVNGGTLELAEATLAANSTVTLASGGVLQLDFAVTNKVAGLVLNGVSQALGVYNSTTSPLYISGAGSLLVATSIATNPTNITTTVSGGNLILSWPADHLGWRLQSQTNSLASGLGTNWVDVTGSTTVNSVTNAINPANGAVFYRMVYP
jgi:autotransporter-associated beta strand protein